MFVYVFPDIDECAKGQCGPYSRQCFNEFSSYNCQCETGFEFDLATNGYGAGCTGDESFHADLKVVDESKIEVRILGLQFKVQGLKRL